MRRLLSILALTVLASGCAATTDDEVGATGDALSALTLTKAACKTPKLTTKPEKTAAGAVIPGTANTSISGCIVGDDETGSEVTKRLAALLGNTAKIGKVKTVAGAKVFAKFEASPATGSLATELEQEVDVTLEMLGSPSARLRITRKLGADGTYALRITNITPFKATLLVFPVTAILPGELTLDVKTKPEANGLTINGAGSVKLEVMPEQAAVASELVRDIFAWLTDELDD